YLLVMEILTKKRMRPLRPASYIVAFKGQLSGAVETIESDLEENGLDKYLETAEALLEKYTATDLAALLLKTVAKDPA
ncbi:ATP-dependent RNA helicase, partial [Enterococcus faecalis]